MTRRLLVIRFSALGDVAMTVPVLNAVATANPDLHITLLTRQRMAPLFSWMPGNVSVVGIDLNQYKGIMGLERLYRQLRTQQFDAVADLHDVLRSKYLRTRFRMNHAQVAVIDKGRSDKKALIGHGLTHPPLLHTTLRYQAVFTALGIECPLPAPTAAPVASVSARRFSRRDAPTAPLIGIAPFAAHEGKIYPPHLMRQVVEALADAGNHIYLFGSAGKEAQMLDAWQREGVESVAGKLPSLRDELELMSRLTLMISMDSSNMHMAAMMGTQTISVWGATHPKAGFTAWQQADDTTIGLPLDCRPCSIYGNRPCHRGGYPCLNGISPQVIIDKARQYGAL